MSPDGHHLFAVNTPDNRLEIFKIKPHGLELRASVPVGLEPVAVAVRSDEEVWVVNHLSDSISVVDVAPARRARVVRTLLVGDEPRDIVFGGPSHNRAFITTAHRGQNAPHDPQLTTPGIGRADVWVFDAANLGASLGGQPLTILSLFSDTPRALAVTPDGSRVYAAGFMTGNRTTTIHELLVPNASEEDGGQPGPRTNYLGEPQPKTALIVKFDGTHWVDELNRVWDDEVKLSLPDQDVFAIDANATPPHQITGAGGVYSGVGTILFNMAVNPVSGKVYVSNTDARNEQRFEGPGIFTGHSLRGHVHESRITVLDGGTVTPRHLNKHIDHDTCCAPVPNAESEASLAQPQEMIVTSDGASLYVAAFGSSKIGVYDTAALENDTFVPDPMAHIVVSGGGPSGLVLDEAKGRLYALTRFDNAIAIIETSTRAEIGKVAMHSPEPPSVVDGRRFLYDASFSSSHGDSSCASCHVFGDFDGLAWDLGNPDAASLNAPGPFIVPPTPPFDDPSFRSLKGPMMTQSFRGMANNGAMHWRGDRTGGNDAPSVAPDGGSFDEVAAFKKFSASFVDLLGRDQPPSTGEMQAFADFILQVTYPPNPIRALDSSLTPDQQAGRDRFLAPGGLGPFACQDCHTLNPAAGAFGTSGLSFPGFTFTLESAQTFKVPHMRNLYQKVGRFGMANDPFVSPRDNDFMGDQVRGFGFTHDGSLDTVFRFHSTEAFSPPGGSPDGFPEGPAGDPLRRQVEQFLMAFDSNMAPIVGQQITLTATNAPVANSRVNLLEARAAAGECDLVAKVAKGGRITGYLYQAGTGYRPDRASKPPVSGSALRQKAQQSGHEITFTCAPPGSGARMALDRDMDGALDGDEDAAGTDPADPTSMP